MVFKLDCCVFAVKGNTPSGYRTPDSIENEVRQGIIYIRFLFNFLKLAFKEYIQFMLQMQGKSEKQR